jgi:AraC-like DNA-binding protein
MTMVEDVGFSEPPLNDSLLNKDWLRPSVHPSYLRLLCAKLLQIGYTEEQIFEGTLFTWEDLLNESRFISFQQYRRLILGAINLTGMPWLNLGADQAILVSSHGILGFGASSGKNIEESLKLIAELSQVRQQVADITFEKREGKSYVVFKPLFDFGDIREQTLSGLVNVIVRLMETISGVRLRGVEIYFSFPEPLHADRFTKWFKHQRLHFNAKETAMYIPEGLLQVSCLTYDPYAFNTAKRECARLLELRNAGGDIAQTIRDYLLEGEVPNLSLETMAERLNMSARNLIRKLKEEDLTYQILLDEVRKEYAVWYLLNSKRSVDSIADLVGYKDTSNFSRTFRRWFGVTPKEFRKNNVELKKIP